MLGEESVLNTQQTQHKSWHSLLANHHRFFFPHLFPSNTSAALNPAQSELNAFISRITQTLFLVSGRVYANLIYGCWRVSVRWKCITLYWAAPQADGARWVIFAGNSPGVTAPSSPRDSDSRHPVHLCWADIDKSSRRALRCLQSHRCTQ